MSCLTPTATTRPHGPPSAADLDRLRAVRILLDDGLSSARIMKVLRISPATYYRVRGELRRLEDSRGPRR